MYGKLRASILPQLIPAKARVLVAVSGGPDSVALAHILWRYVQEDGVNGEIVISHIHHGVRAESDEEAVMVQKLAQEWDIPCLIHRFNAKEYAKLSGQSFQAAAREWRYTRWQEDVRREGCALLATAHHLGDQAETILYRLLRGSGTAGLAGIYPAKGGMVRPFLTVTKQEILEYCVQQRLPYALDYSNEQPIYARNRIRLELLPELERSYNPKVLQALGRTGELLRWDEEYIDDQVEKAWCGYALFESKAEVCLSLDVFREPPAILSRLLRKAATLITNEPRGLGFNYVEKIMSCRGVQGWAQDLPGLKVQVREEGIWFSQQELASSKSTEAMLKLPCVENLRWGEWVEFPAFGISVALFNQTLIEHLPKEIDYDDMIVLNEEEIKRLPSPLVCRTRQSGDKMWFKGVGHKTLKKVFQERRIGKDRRNQIPVIASGEDVLWIPGLRRSDLYYPTTFSKKAVCVVKGINMDSSHVSL